jgi:hypothetical protein
MGKSQVRVQEALEQLPEELTFLGDGKLEAIPLAKGFLPIGPFLGWHDARSRFLLSAFPLRQLCPTHPPAPVERLRLRLGRWEFDGSW